MTIGIETTKALEKEKTGIGWYAYYIIKYLLKNENTRHKYLLYINPSARMEPTDLPHARHSRIKPLFWPFAKFWTQGRLRLEMKTHPPDVLFIPAYMPPRTHPETLVVTVHDLGFKAFPETYSKKELKQQEQALQVTLLRASDIIVPTLFTKDEITRWYGHTKDNIKVVPHGVDTDMFTPKPYVERNNTILYVGRLEHKKNTQNLIRAFTLLKSHHPLLTLTLIGSKGYGYEEIKNEINASPFKKDIHELGWQDREGIKKHIQYARVFVLPSLYEGFGMPLLEAMACGTPVVCSDIPPLREIGGDVPLYFDPHNPEDIAQKLKEILMKKSDPHDTRGIAHAQTFSWENTAQQTLEILTKPLV